MSAATDKSQEIWKGLSEDEIHHMYKMVDRSLERLSTSVEHWLPYSLDETRYGLRATCEIIFTEIESLLNAVPFALDPAEYQPKHAKS